MKSSEFIERLKDAAQNHKTAYMWGTYGNKISKALITSKEKQYPNRYSEARKEYLESLIPEDYWGFDCAGLIKGILWGWEGDLSKNRGGGSYKANNVPDTNVSGLRKRCSDLSSDFTTMAPAELVFMDGHVGVYIGDGRVIEATLGNGYDGVVETNLAGRGWVEHGKLDFIEYEKEASEMNLCIHVSKIGLYVRESLTFNKRKKASGKILAFCPIGKEMEILEFIPGIQADGYQWVRTRYKGVEGYSQYDSQCYYIFNKGE